jgi:riboflavin synthase
MFTGIIKTTAKVLKSRGSLLRVQAPLKSVGLGDSIAVNGTCLTVAKIAGRTLDFELSGETLSRTNLSALRPGNLVNLEPSLRAGDVLGGHLVTGHVDAQGKILKLRRLVGNFADFTVGLPHELKGLVALKGSIAVDGISLTVSAIKAGEFSAAIVPFTLLQTNLNWRKIGEFVNLEADLIARYVAANLRSR